MTQELDPKALRKVAEQATPGPWKASTHSVYKSDDSHAVDSVESDENTVISQLGCGCCDVGLEISKPDTAFVTTFDPTTILALLTQLEQAEKNADTYQTLYEQRAESLEQAEAQVARVREMKEGQLCSHCLSEVESVLDGEPNG